MAYDDREPTDGVTGLIAVAAAMIVCCGLPIFLGVGIVVGAAGVAIGSGVVVAVGVALAVLAWRRREARACDSPPDRSAGV